MDLARRRGLLPALALVAASSLPAAAVSLYPDARVEMGADQGMVLADVDGDGRMDLVGVGALGVSTLLARGDGTYEDPILSEVGDGGWALVLRDFDDDGNLDVALHGYYQGYVAVAAGRGEGHFGPETRLPTEYRGLAVASGDFDGDGIEDLVSTNWYDETVSVLMGTGGGAFGPEARLGVGPRPQGLAARDLNGDGLDDVVVATTDWYSPYDQTVSVLLARAGGGFEPEVRHAVGGSPWALAVADWNRDGRVDVAVANLTSNDISFLPSHGAGTFGTESRHRLSGGPVALDHADLNRDGNEDLVAVGDGGIWVLLGDGLGGFTESAMFPGEYLTAVTIDDGDGDGNLDLAVLDAGVVQEFLGDGAGGFAPPHRRNARFAVGDVPSAIVSGDLNGDGHVDLVTANRVSDDLSVLLGDGTGGFAPGGGVPVGDRPEALALADFDGDGPLDLAVGSVASEDLRIFRGAGDGSFALVWQIDAPLIGALIATDLDLDGSPDIAAVLGQELVVLLGLGDGTFEEVARAAIRTVVATLTAGDLNLDGIPDLVAGGLSVHLGRGDGTLEPPIQYPDAYRADAVIMDSTGDGLPDLVVAGRSQVGVLPGDGSGNLETDDPYGERTYRVGELPRDLVAGDLNGDGRPDLATANSVSGDVSVLLSQTRTPARQVRFRVGQEPWAIATGDFDGNGGLDLAVANRGSNDVSILLNQGRVPNLPPVAHIEWTSETDCASGGATVDLTSQGTADLNSSPGTLDDIVSYQWEWRPSYPAPPVDLGTTPSVQAHLPPGDHTIVLRVADRRGQYSYDSIRVLLEDRPPALSLNLEPGVLWPPNHRLVEVQANPSVEDECPGVMLTLESVVSDEPDDAPGPGDGETAGDVEAATGTSAPELLLRAERDGSGDGRTYTITYRAVDVVGQETFATGTVVVPHDRGGSAEPIELRAAQVAGGTILAWTPVPEAVHYNVIRGDLGRLRHHPSTTHLGPVRCIESGSVDNHTITSEDAEAPARGEAFFYLVEYFDGGHSSYGTESASRPRLPQSGDCR